MFKYRLVKVLPDGQKEKWSMAAKSLEEAIENLEHEVVFLLDVEERKGNEVSLDATDEGTFYAHYVLNVTTPEGKQYTRELSLQ